MKRKDIDMNWKVNSDALIVGHEVGPQHINLFIMIKLTNYEFQSQSHMGEIIIIRKIKLGDPF